MSANCSLRSPQPLRRLLLLTPRRLVRLPTVVRPVAWLMFYQLRLLPCLLLRYRVRQCPRPVRPWTSSLTRICRASASLVIREPFVPRNACTSKASWQIELERVGLPVEKSDLVVIFVRVFRLRGWQACAGISSAFVFALHRGFAFRLVVLFYLVLTRVRLSRDSFALFTTCGPDPVARCAVDGFSPPLSSLLRFRPCSLLSPSDLFFHLSPLCDYVGFSSFLFFPLLVAFCSAVVFFCFVSDPHLSALIS